MLRILKISAMLCCITVLNGISQQNVYKFNHIDYVNGLSNNQINNILKDQKGFIWISTMSGLNRYDGSKVRIFKHDVNDSLSIIDNYIYKVVEDFNGNLLISTRSGYSVYNPLNETFNNRLEKYLQENKISLHWLTNILKDNSNNIWYINYQEGICQYNASEKKFKLLKHSDTDTTTVSNYEVSGIEADYKGNYWITYKNGLLEKLNGKTLKVVQREYCLYNYYKATIGDFTTYIDNDNNLWIYMPVISDGIYWYNPEKRLFKHITKDSQIYHLNNNMVQCVVQDNAGKIWIGTDHGGINILDRSDFSIRYVLNNPEDQSSLSQNSITSFYKDNSGIIWIGTFKNGVNYYHENIIRFKLLKHQTSNPSSLSFDDVNCFAEDDKENIWIGTNGGGLLYYDRKKDSFKSYKFQPDNPNSLSNNIIVCLAIDHEKKLWIGTYFGGLDCFSNNKFIHYKHNENDPTSVADNRIWEIFEDRDKNLWIGTLGGGLDLFDRKTRSFTHYKQGALNSVHSNYISTVIEDDDKNLWIGTAHGIDLFDRTADRFIHFSNDANNPGSLSNNNVNAIVEDSHRNIWIGTREGLNLYDKENQTFKIFRVENGLPDNTIVSMLADNAGNLWLGTPNGLSNLIITKKPDTDSILYVFKNYDETDGLQGRAFNENAALKTRQGELLFGGVNGFNIFKPDDIKTNTNLPKVILTDLQIFNKSIRVNEKFDGRYILKKTISETNEITLKYSENIISLEFAVLSYFHPEKNKYQYKLDGFNDKWLTTDENTRKAIYTNLDPGTYVFRVKASNNDGLWNEDGISLVINILPPIWRTKIAIILYALFILGLLILARKFIMERARLKFNLEHERQEAIRRHDMDMMKIKFFTNISHEFRTPLSLILTPLEKIIKITSDADLLKQLSMMNRNAKRLLNLVNQLLDFRRMEVKELTLSPTSGNIIEFIKDVALSFSDLSEKKDIKLTIKSDIQELIMFFDNDKLEKILFNLLSNAFKFTPEHGNVTVEVKMFNRNNPGSVDIPNIPVDWIQVQVKDSGIGIEKDKHQKIFERFFQNDIPGSVLNQGSGIGLSLTYEFVKLHGGIIYVESEPNKGSCFTVLLPVKEISHLQLSDNHVVSETVINPQNSHENIPGGEHDTKKRTILLVEDNEDFKFYLKDNLSTIYNIIEAPNGQEGLKLAISVTPDLIVSDIMMPFMDGIELCKNIKSDKRISHIPIILLTARASDEQKMEGFETGADDYITKPFNFEILQARIKNLIQQRELMHKGYLKQIEIKPSQVEVVSLDEKIIQKAVEIVEKNLSDADFSVEDLSKELGMSRFHLYKKLLSLTGKTPIEFIRIIRLKHAAQLLGKSQLTVSEIAYQVGFNNPKYFTKYFKAEFNVLPSQYSGEQMNNMD